MNIEQEVLEEFKKLKNRMEQKCNSTLSKKEVENLADELINHIDMRL